MFTKRKENGKRSIDWTRVTEGLFVAVGIALLTGGFNWFLNVRDLKHDFKEQRKDLKSISNQTALIGRTLWYHIHPEEPCPWPLPKDHGNGHDDHEGEIKSGQ